MESPQQSLQGKLILDSGKLAGSYFDQTAILICEHDESGAAGLVLNHSLKHNLGSLAHGLLVEGLAKAPLYRGGPVHPDVISFLAESELQSNFDMIPKLMVGHSMEPLVEQFKWNNLPSQLRIYSGYAGWSPDQLEKEIENGCWVIHPASLSLIFDPKPETLWHRILHKKGGLFRFIAKCPPNPSLN